MQTNDAALYTAYFIVFLLAFLMLLAFAAYQRWRKQDEEAS